MLAGISPWVCKMDIFHFTRNSGPNFCKSETALIWWKVCSFNSFIHHFHFNIYHIISFLILFSLFCNSQSLFRNLCYLSCLLCKPFFFFFAVNSFAVFLNYSLIKLIKKWFLRFMQGFSLSKQQFKALWPLLMNRFQLSQGNRATMKRQFI